MRNHSKNKIQKVNFMSVDILGCVCYNTYLGKINNLINIFSELHARQ
jgi:hypothetical protein